MMIPDAAEVTRRRVSAALAIRVLTVPFLYISLFPIAAWIGEGVDDGDLFEIGYYLGQIVVGVVGICICLTVMALAGVFSRLLIKPTRYNKCPGCHYRLEGLIEPRCSECGLELSREFMGEPREPGKLEPMQVYRARMVSVFAPIVRLCAGLIMFVSAFIGGLIFLVMMFNGRWQEEPLAVATTFAVGALFSMGVFLSGDSIASFMVPKFKDLSEPGTEPDPGPKPGPEADPGSGPKPETPAT